MLNFLYGLKMWSQYDEDLSQNNFFIEIKGNHEDILKRAAEEHWIICIPRKGSLTTEDISMSVILDHILTPISEKNYRTLNKKDVYLENHNLKLDKSNIFYSQVEILFEETHYIEQTAKYTVWCINWPLFAHQNRIDYSNNNARLLAIQDCIDFLYSETFGYNLLKSIQNLCTDFWKNHEDCFETETLQCQKDYLGNLYSHCLQLAFQNEAIRYKCDNNAAFLDKIKVSVETYMQYCLGRKLIYSVNTLHHVTDSMINKTVRNYSDITLNELNIPSAFSDLVVDGKYELSKINNFVTVLDKVHCLSQTFNIFNNKFLENEQKLYVTSDDFLQILVYLILKCNVSNWVANLTYLKEFQFATFANPDQTNFLVTSLEAAVAFIKSSQFLCIKQSINNLVCSGLSIFDELYLKFRDKKDVAELEELLAKKKNEEHLELCHPLCSCQKCEKIQSQRVDTRIDSRPYKILNDFDQNFLIMACIENNPVFLEFLLTLDFDINFIDSFGKTALHYAAENGYQDILLLLINAGADVNILDNYRNTALHLSCDRGHEYCVKALIYSSHFVEINLQNISGETPLFLATRWGYFDIIKILLENGASVCVKNKRNMSIYKLSPNYYITKLFRLFGSQKSNNILEEVIKDKSQTTYDNILEIPEDCCNKMYSSFEQQAMLFGVQAKSKFDVKKIELLLKTIENNDIPLTCFYLGYVNNALGGEINKNVIKCHPLCTCIKCSTKEDSDDTSDNLEENSLNDKRECKFNINMCNKEGFTSLHTAAKFGRTEILRVLLDGGALLNVRTIKTFYTPLHLAVMFQQFGAVKELLNCGDCNVDAQDFKGNTSLYYACVKSNDNLKIVELLLLNGADCQKKNCEEKTVLQICEEKNLFRICRLLRESMGYFSPQTKLGNFSHGSSNISFEDVNSDFECFSPVS